MNKNTPEDYHDIFDRAFKRIITLSGRGVICMINGLFGTNYPLDASITYNSTEAVDGTLQKHLADNIMTIDHTDSFHIEAEMDPDSDIHIRIMEYGFLHALRTMPTVPLGKLKEGDVIMQFPRQCMIYLGQRRNIPDRLPVTIRFQGEEDHIHKIPVIHFQERQTQELLDQKLFILLPFRLLRIRRELEKNHSKEGVRTLIDLYKNDIIDPINKATEQGYLSWRDRLNLLAISRRLVRHLYEGYDEVREEVKLMRYQTLDLDIDEYDEKYEALEEKYNALEEQLAEKDSQLSEKDSQLSEKDSQLSEKDSLLSEKDSLLSEKDQEILRLKAQLAKLQNK